MKKRGGNPEPPALPLPLFGGILRKNDEVFSMQPRFRTLKTTIRTRLQEPGWDDFAKELDEVPARELVGPLFSCLPLGGEATDRAASALGKAVSRMADEHIEEARNVVRRLMWHMNEESGNIGWGIPEAFGESLAASPLLAKDFHRVLASYLIDLGRDDNYCDNDLLRRSCYWAVGRLAQTRPELCAGARPWLRKGLEDNDVICRGMAAWALAQLPPDFMDTPALRRLADAGHEEICELFDGEQLYEKSISQLAREALAREVPAAADPDRP